MDINEPPKLSIEQQEPINSSKRFIKILAGAGSGKTEILTRKIIDLILHQKVEPGSIVAFTFTEKAAAEMINRLRVRLKYLSPEFDTSLLGKMYIGTIHSFCFKLLQDHFNYGIYNILDENTELAYLLRRGFSYGLKSVEYNYITNCKIFHTAVNIFYDECIDRNKLSDTGFLEILDKYVKDMNRDKLLSFSRLVPLAVEAIQKNHSKIDFIKYLLIDEYQDINKVQYESIKLLGRNSGIFVVGDPRQSIYQWRGSDYKYFMDFEHDFQGTESFEIKGNRRSGNSIVELSNKIADNMKEKYPPMQAINNKNSFIIRKKYTDSKNEAVSIAKIIDENVRKNNMKYSDFAILYRSVKNSAANLLEELQKLKIPYIIAGNYGLFKRKEIIALGEIFCSFGKNGYWGTGKNKIDINDLIYEGVQNWSEVININKTESIKKIEKIREKLYSFSDYKEIYVVILDALNFKILDYHNDDDAAIIANIGRFTQVIGDHEKAMRYGGEHNIKHEMDSLVWYLNFYGDAYGESEPVDVSISNFVRVSTVHQAKGLEWPVVFIPSVVPRKFPLNQRKNSNYMIDDSLYDLDRYSTDYDSELRLFYVAVTRAKNYCILSDYGNLESYDRESEFIKIVDKLNPNSKICDITIDPGNNSDDLMEIPVTSMVDYERCPYHYFLSSKLGYTQGVSYFMGYGEIQHFILRTISEGIKKNIKYNKITITELVNELFFLPFGSDGFNVRQKADVSEKIWNLYSKHMKDRNINEMESRISLDTEGAVINGKIDVVVNNKTDIEIWDYKASNQTVADNEAKLQILLYALAMENMGFTVKSTSIISIKENEKRDFPVNTESLHEIKQTANNIIKNIKSLNFEGKKSKFCNNCEYNKICKYTN